MNDKESKYDAILGPVRKSSLKPVTSDALLEIMKEKRLSLVELAHQENLIEFERELNSD